MLSGLDIDEAVASFRECLALWTVSLPDIVLGKNVLFSLILGLLPDAF